MAPGPAAPPVAAIMCKSADYVPVVTPLSELEQLIAPLFETVRMTNPVIISSILDDSYRGRR